MYDVTLINLAADARSAAADLEPVERRGMPAGEMQRLLQDFCAIDALENATADPEIRIRVRHESYLIRHGQRKLIFYDANDREAPGQLLTVEEVMAELDGTARAARTAAPFEFAEASRPAAMDLAPVEIRPAARPSTARMIALVAVNCALVATHIWWRLPPGTGETPAFRRMDAAEVAGLPAKMAGVYLTGTQPGQHGVALTSTGELRLFELRGVDAPRVVHATFQLGRVGSNLCLATDQPGGLIALPDPDTMIYCGETYRRVP